MAAGDSVAHIAAATGFSRSAIYQRLRRDRLTLTPRAGAKPTDAALVDQIVELYVTDRASIRRVAAAVDRSTDWVRTQLVHAGVSLRNQRRTACPRRRRPHRRRGPTAGRTEP